jgi:hypothetical protein
MLAASPVGTPVTAYPMAPVRPPVRVAVMDVIAVAPAITGTAALPTFNANPGAGDSSSASVAELHAWREMIAVSTPRTTDCAW